jgi:hypothetical protein
VRSHRYIQKIDFYGIKYEAEFIRCKSRERYSVKYNIKKVDNNLIGKNIYSFILNSRLYIYKYFINLKTIQSILALYRLLINL